MLGGYYLGQLYLGISGLPAAGENPTLTVQPSSHQLSSDNITLTQKHTIVVNSASHTLTSDNITLIQKHLLVVEDALHTLMSENVALTSEHFLGVNDAFHGLTSTEIALTQKHTIVVDNTTHTLSSDNLDIVEHKLLVVADAYHGHTVNGDLEIVVHFYLVVQNALHSHTAQNIALTQKHDLVVNNTLHELTSRNISGFMNIEPFGFGGGFGAIDGWGVKQFGEINIELPLNFLIQGLDSTIGITSDKLLEFIQIFNFIKTGIYIKDFENDGAMGGEYEPAVGTVPKKYGSFGQIAPDENDNYGFLIVDVDSIGSYEQDTINSGILNRSNRGQGQLAPEVASTGNYIKANNNTGEYEVE